MSLINKTKRNGKERREEKLKVKVNIQKMLIMMVKI